MPVHLFLCLPLAFCPVWAGHYNRNTATLHKRGSIASLAPDTMMYSARTDDQLAVMAQKGDREAEEAVVKRYQPVVKGMARDYSVRGMEKGDIEGEALLALVRAIRTFNPEKAQFGTYSRRCMMRALVDKFRSSNKQGEIPAEMLVNINSVRQMADGEELGLEDIVAGPSDTEAEVIGSSENMERLESVMSATWPPFRDAIAGYTHAEVACRNQLNALAVQSVIAAIDGVARCTMEPELYADLRDLVIGFNDSQPALFGPARGSDDAKVISFAVFHTFREVRNAVLQDLTEGYSYQEMADRNGLDVVTVSRLLAALRAIACPSGELDHAA